MIKNIYGPLSSAVMREKEIDIIANNIANVNTTSFKEDLMASTATMANPWPNYPDPNPPAPLKIDMGYLNPLHGNEMQYTALSSVKTDHSAGAMQLTKRDLDFALAEPDSYFEIMTPMGARYTRDGSFDVTAQGFLATKDGYVVQGEQGPISGFTGDKVQVLSSGDVYNGEKFLGRMKLVNIEQQEHLERLGKNLWVYNGNPDSVKPSTSKVMQGALEASNVNPVKNLVNMITAQRHYEASQKAIKSHDETMRLGNKLSDVNS